MSGLFRAQFAIWWITLFGICWVKICTHGEGTNSLNLNWLDHFCRLGKGIRLKDIQIIEETSILQIFGHANAKIGSLINFVPNYFIFFIWIKNRMKYVAVYCYKIEWKCKIGSHMKVGVFLLHSPIYLRIPLLCYWGTADTDMAVSYSHIRI